MIALLIGDACILLFGFVCGVVASLFYLTRDER